MSGILIVTDHTRGVFSAVSLEILELAGRLRSQGMGPVRVAVIGSHMRTALDKVDVEGVDEVLLVESAAQEFDGGLYGTVALDLASQYQSRLVLTGHTANTMAYAGGLAVRLGAGFAADVFDVRPTEKGIEATRGGFGNKVNVSIAFPGKSSVVLTVRGGTYKAPAPVTREAARRAMVPPLGGEGAGWRHEEFIEAPTEGVDLSKSEFILAVGRGIQDEKNVQRFAELARRLGATLACSRPVADAGWLPKNHQVGLTGKPASACRVYLALGISGAVQHLWGMKHVETIIAVNTDANAPIFGAATYGVTADLFAITEALERRVPA